MLFGKAKTKQWCTKVAMLNLLPHITNVCTYMTLYFFQQMGNNLGCISDEKLKNHEKLHI